MSNLLQAYDSYNDFERYAYFTLCYNAIPSSLKTELPLDANHQNIKTIIKHLKLNAPTFELIYKKWDTEDTKNADFSNDYPYEHLFKSKTSSCVIWLLLEDDSLTVEFLYDCQDKALEQWVIETNHNLRSQFGLNRTPSFNVLIKCGEYYRTDEVRMDNIVVDVLQNYNDDFQAVDTIIRQSITAKQSGLILLHGVPGTGKTTYIKSLISAHQDLNFIFVQNEFVHQLLEPDFISFLLKQRNAILIIEDAEKVITSREHIRESSVVSTILQLTDGLFSDYLNIKVICTFNTHISKIDTALLRKGRMIAMYDFKPLSVEKTNQLLSTLDLPKQHQAMTISDIYNFKQEIFNDIKRKQIGFQLN